MLPSLVYSTVGIYTILNTQQAAEIFARVISVSLNGLTSSLSLMAYNNSNQTIKGYMDELEILDIEIKLKMIDLWLKSIDYKDIKPKSSFDIIYKGLADTCHQMSNLICIINKKITDHTKLWFSRWRSINLESEIKKIGRLTKILSDRILLINILENKNTIEKNICKIETPTDINESILCDKVNKTQNVSEQQIVNEPGETKINDFTII